MCKAVPKHDRLLPFSVIQAAVRGDPDAVAVVLRHFSGYIAALSRRHFYDRNGNYSTMNSYTDAVKREQVTAYVEKDTLYVEYRLGDYALTADSVPQKMSIRRFESFIAKLPEDKADMAVYTAAL